MNITGKSRTLVIILGESEKLKGKPLYEETVKKARELGLAGATVTRGIMSYGGTSRIHSVKIERLSEDLPVTITIIDTEENISKLVPYLEEHVKGGIVYSIPCDVILYRHEGSSI